MDKVDLQVGSTYMDTISGNKVLIESIIRDKYGIRVLGKMYNPETKSFEFIDIDDGQLTQVVVDDIDGF